jgi:hypothetical protein
MSPSLVADVAARTQARWLEAVPLLRGLPPALIVDLASSLGTRSFSPDEVRTLAFVLKTSAPGLAAPQQIMVVFRDPIAAFLMRTPATLSSPPMP